jgi:hypothetical protein
VVTESKTGDDELGKAYVEEGRGMEMADDAEKDGFPELEQRGMENKGVDE